VTGLAWTEVGGDLLTIETACVPGKGKLTYTGSLGEVMQESIQAALTVVRARRKNWVSTRISTKNAIFTFTYRKGRRRKMVQARVLPCVPRWSPA
jgi:ATP-dependent Lon protease